MAIPQGLAKEGAAVILNGRSTTRVDEALAALNKAGATEKPEGLAADLGTADGTRRAVERFPEVDILVNNVGIFEIKPFENIPDADWASTLPPRDVFAYTYTRWRGNLYLVEHGQ